MSQDFVEWREAISEREKKTIFNCFEGFFLFFFFCFCMNSFLFLFVTRPLGGGLGSRLIWLSPWRRGEVLAQEMKSEALDCNFLLRMGKQRRRNQETGGSYPNEISRKVAEATEVNDWFLFFVYWPPDLLQKPKLCQGNSRASLSLIAMKSH